MLLGQFRLQLSSERFLNLLCCNGQVIAHNGALPRLQCKTCDQRFHSGCLYKWFQQSSKSNCPHCQSVCPTPLIPFLAYFSLGFRALVFLTPGYERKPAKCP
eukprot:COSAG04_NODE_146_length_22922_cov_53.506901_8_plen_102_part_00